MLWQAAGWVEAVKACEVDAMDSAQGHGALTQGWSRERAQRGSSPLRSDTQGERGRLTLCVPNSHPRSSEPGSQARCLPQAPAALPGFEELMAVMVSRSQQMKGREQAPWAL